MPHRLSCTYCGALLSVREDAPQRITCPRCMASLVNANPSSKEIALPAVPLDREIGNDLFGVRYVMTFLAIGLIVTAIVSVWGQTSQGRLAGVLVIAGVVIGAVSAFMHTFHKSGRERNGWADSANAPALREGSILEYQGRVVDPARSAVTVGSQMAIGFFVWVMAVALCVWLFQSRQGVRSGNAEGAWVVIATILAVLGGMALWLRMRLRWRGFIPGLLLGLGITCLLPVGIIFVICGR